MIDFGREYFFNNNYFFLRKREDRIDVYFNVNENLSEARDFDEMVSLPLNAEKKIKYLVEKLTKTKKKFSRADLKKLIDSLSSKESGKEEVDELVDFDGSFSSSKIPIHDPKMSPTKTMDQTVFATRQAGDPVMRGYRVYYGESVVREEDLSGAFGYEEVSGMTYEDCVDYMKSELEVENPEERCSAFGKSPKLDAKGQERLVEKTLSEIQRQKMIGVLEDLIVKKTKNDDLQSKEKFQKIDELPSVVKKNLKSLLKQMKSSGIEKSEIIKLIKNEQ